MRERFFRKLSIKRLYGMHNVCQKVVFTLLVVAFLTTYTEVLGMELLLTSDVTSIRDRFLVAERLATGNKEERNEADAEKHFEKLAEQEIDEEVCAWSTVWLAKYYYLRQDKSKAEEYLEKADNLQQKAPALSSISLIVPLLKKYEGREIPEQISHELIERASSEANANGLAFVLEMIPRNKWGMLVLKAAAQGKKDIVEGLIHKKSGLVNTPDSFGRTPLLKAMGKGYEVNPYCFSSIKVQSLRLTLSDKDLSASYYRRHVLASPDDDFPEIEELRSGPFEISICDNQDKELAVCRGHEDEIVCFTVTPDENMVVSGSKDGSIKIWNMQAKLLAECKVLQGGDLTSLAIQGEKVLAFSDELIIGTCDISILYWLSKLNNERAEALWELMQRASLNECTREEAWQEIVQLVTENNELCIEKEELHDVANSSCRLM